MEKTDPVWQNLQRFANDHKVILEDHGEVGFGRSCVGFIGGTSFVAFNPVRMIGDFGPIEELQDERLNPPPAVVHAYHKHDCLAVLVNDGDYDAALRELNLWVEHLEAQGEVAVVEYCTEAQGIQAIVSGVTGYAVRFKK